MLARDVVSPAGFFPILLLLSAALAAQQAAPPPQPELRASVLPLAFEPAADAASFAARGRGYAARVGSTGVRLVLRGERRGAEATIDIEICGADPVSHGRGEDRLPGHSSHYLGDDPSQWRTDVPHFRRVRFQDVVPGVDVVYYGNQRRLEYDLIVAPGVDPERIELSMQGVDSIDLSDGGDLLLTIGGRVVTQHAPVLHQEIHGCRTEVAGRYVLRGERSVGFAVGERDPGQALVIDPVIAYGTYLGGSSEDRASGIAVDQAGNLYVTGMTASADFPSPGAPPQIRGLYDIFVAKIDPTGSQLLYSTTVGGTGASYSDNEWPLGIGVDALGRVVVVGRTVNSDFPTLNAAQPSIGGLWDAVVFQLDADGALSWSTFLGGSSDEMAFSSGIPGGGPQAPGGIAVDPAGNVTAVGATWSTDFPVQEAMQSSLRGVVDGFIARYDPAGRLVYSTYLGGSNYDDVRDAFLTPQDLVALTGESRSADFPVTSSTLSGPYSGFVMLFDAAAQSIVRSTLFPVIPAAVAVDGAGNVYLGGGTRGGVPTTPGAYMTTHGGSVNSHWIQGFAVKLDPDLSNVLYGTYYGANTADEYFEDIAVTPAGELLIGGTVISHFVAPTTYEAVAWKLNAAASDFAWILPVATYSSEGWAVARGGQRQMFFAGETRVTSGIATEGAVQTTNAGSRDAFLVRIDDGGRARRRRTGQPPLAGGMKVSLARDTDDQGPMAGDGELQRNSDRPTAFRPDPPPFAPYGHGCPDAGGRVPGLTGLGCPMPGNTVEILLSGRPGAMAMVAGGSAAGRTPQSSSCNLLVGEPLFNLAGPIVLDATGNHSISLPLPANLLAGSLFLQGFVLDAAATNGFAASRGLEIRIPY